MRGRSTTGVPSGGPSARTDATSTYRHPSCIEQNATQDSENGNENSKFTNKNVETERDREKREREKRVIDAPGPSSP